MAKAKTKSGTVPKRRPASKGAGAIVLHRKAALRSEAFARALTDAKSHANEPERLRALFHEAAGKVASIPKEPFKENWPYLQAMLRFLRAYHRGDYRQVADTELVWVVTALNYLVDPFDLIPDEVPFLGFVDDAAVVEFAVSRTRETLDNFMIWETHGITQSR